VATSIPLALSLPPPPDRARRVLVVDDDEARRNLFARVLEAEGHEVDLLPDGEHIFTHIHTRPPDLVILDVLMPGSSGLEICADLRMMDEMKLTPIILVTCGLGDEDSVVRGLMCGADDYIVTPSRLAELRARVHVQLRNRREREMLAWVRKRGAAMRDAALHDPLTGLANRRAADEAIDEALLSGEPLVVVMLDLDHFKSVNDTYGHGAGDRVLQTVATRLGGRARRGDLAARYGGEEFLVIARGAQPSVAAAIGERYRQAIQELKMPPDAGVEGVTASVGVAACDEILGRRLSRGVLLEAADAALYEAKRTGRNRVIVARPSVYPPRHAQPGAEGERE
jgi:two-component system cell cycle response regulator